MLFNCGKFTLTLNRPHVMGILNVTPDSFSDGGHFNAKKQAIEHAIAMAEAGADIIDIGGESTRPNAEPVPLQAELDRVMPILEALVARVSIPISIDTYKPQLMRAAITSGASIINDICALQEPGALETLAESDVGVCLMHMQGRPQTMQINPSYENVVDEVGQFLQQRLAACISAGISQDRVLLDPGFGFGKTRQHNIQLIQALSSLADIGPLLVGLSRKSVLGQMTGNDIDARLNASVTAAVIAAIKGAKIVRVHDVKATVEALKVVEAIQTPLV